MIWVYFIGTIISCLVVGYVSCYLRVESCIALSRAISRSYQAPEELLRTCGHPRSSKWEALEKAHLKANPDCLVCGRRDKPRCVHHFRPFHLHPELELDPKNLRTVCIGFEHLFVGHLGNYQSVNKDFDQDAAVWEKKIEHRP